MGLVRSGWVKLGLVGLGWVGLGLVGSGQVGLGQVGSGRVRLGWIRSILILEKFCLTLFCKLNHLNFPNGLAYNNTE